MRNSRKIYYMIVSRSTTIAGLFRSASESVSQRERAGRGGGRWKTAAGERPMMGGNTLGSFSQVFARATFRILCYLDRGVFDVRV